MTTLKYRDELFSIQKNSYASSSNAFPEDSIDCSEGINPFGCPTELTETIQHVQAKISDYPHDHSMYEAIKDYWKPFVELHDENILLADGSMPLIYTTNTIFANKGAKVLGVAPNFSDYASNARLHGMDYQYLELIRSENYSFPYDELLDTITSDLSLLYLDNPNNPTGSVLPISYIRKVLDKATEAGVCVILDEAYGDFISREESAITLIEDYDNLIVFKTLSKGFALAGIRAGYAIANTEIINMLNQFSNPYTVGAMNRKIVSAALRIGLDQETQWQYFKESKEQVRQVIGHTLHMGNTDDRVPIFLLYHTEADFNLAEALKNNGIIAIDGSSFDAINASCTRVRLPHPSLFPAFLEKIKQCESSLSTK